MTGLLFILTGLAVLLGIGVAVWSFVDTRRKHYNEYMSRKSK